MQGFIHILVLEWSNFFAVGLCVSKVCLDLKMSLSLAIFPIVVLCVLKSLAICVKFGFPPTFSLASIIWIIFFLSCRRSWVLLLDDMLRVISENDHFFKEKFTLLRKNTLKSEIMNGFLFSDRDYKRCFYIVKKVFREKSEIIYGPRLHAARLQTETTVV